MSPNSGFQWFAIQTKPGAEVIADHTLGTLGLETLLPMVRKSFRRNERRCCRVRPFFPSYCFARFQPQVHLHCVRYSRGVLRVVGTGETPWPVEESIIEDIRGRVGEDGLIRVTTQPLQAGDRVRICQGPFAGWAGIFDREMDDRVRVVILLEAINLARVVLERDSLELAEAV